MHDAGQRLHSNQTPSECTKSGLDVVSKDNDLSPLVGGQSFHFRPAKCQVQRLDLVDEHGVHPVPEFPHHPHTRQEVPLSIVTHEAVRALGIQRSVLLEIAELLACHGLEVALGHERVAGVEVPGEECWHDVEVTLPPQAVELLQTGILGESPPDMWARREKHHVPRPPRLRHSRSPRPPRYLRPVAIVEAGIKLKKEPAHTGVDRAVGVATVHSRRVPTAGGHEGVIHVAEDLALRHSLAPVRGVGQVQQDLPPDRLRRYVLPDELVQVVVAPLGIAEAL
mmetsp:Transcript_75636/g.202195  ORF Transcript_75636/g.202195 Transcript_75636/m.202195 type:complete len:281 (+) Transcript_75636:658-1500(+)